MNKDEIVCHTTSSEVCMHPLHTQNVYKEKVEFVVTDFAPCMSVPGPMSMQINIDHIFIL